MVIDACQKCLKFMTIYDSKVEINMGLLNFEGKLPNKKDSMLHIDVSRIWPNSSLKRRIGIFEVFRINRF